GPDNPIPGCYKTHLTFQAGYRASFFNPPVSGDTGALGSTIAHQVVLDIYGKDCQGAPGSALCPVSGKLQSYPLPLTVTQLVPEQDVLYASGTIDLVVPISEFPLTVTFSYPLFNPSFPPCCTISALLEGNHDIGYPLTVIIDPTKGTRSPMVTSPA